ncbi:unnamed protein product [Fraxinus pennsylvanica]|uniref:Uncharacterized protein n=1 Tax=Fraxinus pennsylvanica TaxID=56036 RepID=A0AAD1YRU0_9LAMI|nr:unnamed protein product [Fraxinus pennsylvanica]
MKLPCTFPTHSVDCPFSCKPHCVSNGPVFVIVIENDKMFVQELPANSSVINLLERTGRGSYRWTPYGFPMKEELRPRLNHEPVSDPTCKLKMGDVVELTPAIPDNSLIEYREEIQPMYDRGLTISKHGACCQYHGWVKKLTPWLLQLYYAIDKRLVILYINDNPLYRTAYCLCL